MGCNLVTQRNGAGRGGTRCRGSHDTPFFRPALGRLAIFLGPLSLVAVMYFGRPCRVTDGSGRSPYLYNVDYFAEGWRFGYTEKEYV